MVLLLHCHSPRRTIGILLCAFALATPFLHLSTSCCYQSILRPGLAFPSTSPSIHHSYTRELKSNNPLGHHSTVYAASRNITILYNRPLLHLHLLLVLLHAFNTVESLEDPCHFRRTDCSQTQPMGPARFYGADRHTSHIVGNNGFLCAFYKTLAWDWLTPHTAMLLCLDAV